MFGGYEPKVYGGLFGRIKLCSSVVILWVVLGGLWAWDSVFGGLWVSSS